MKNKDIAFLKIIQYIISNKNVSRGEIYSYFDIIPDGKGGYKNNGKWPFEQRSLSRYIDELESLEIIKKNESNIYSINDEKFIDNNNNKENKLLEQLLYVLLQSRELELFNQIGNIANKKINEEYVNKIINAIDIPFEEVKIDETIEEKIKLAICNSEKIEIQYKNKKYNIIPVAIVKNMNKNKKYLFYLERRKLAHPFDLSNIRSVKILNKKDFQKEKYIEEIERRWDIDGGNPQEVEVLFFDKATSRLNEELSKEKIENNFEKTEDGQIYKDTIDGINDFKKWIKTFGDECIILKPEKLRDEIINDYNLKEERYKKVINNEI